MTIYTIINDYGITYATEYRSDWEDMIDEMSNFSSSRGDVSVGIYRNIDDSVDVDDIEVSRDSIKHTLTQEVEADDTEVVEAWYVQEVYDDDDNVIGYADTRLDVSEDTTYETEEEAIDMSKPSQYLTI